ncbi:MAG: low specificity L-threonine aldolase [Ruminococcaceae bacterium]|nr:low specificity L-threonine aldolase [Oscillospiraceae bacterium]
MLRFESDYLEGAHPKILEKLIETNFEQTAGYGVDDHCERARELIKKACGAPDAYVQFLVGGTQTNATVIASLLRPYEGVLSAVSGHINVHETGAIEATGHKVLPLASEDGKITASQIENAYSAHINDSSFEHMVKPALVYISQPTENGTLYSKSELEAIREACDNCKLRLFIDGARCGYGLKAENNDVFLPDLARLSDVFYIGGTKVGALFGEAVVFSNKKLCENFRYMIKRHGGMLAKGRLLGIQFETLFEDGLYFEISEHAMRLALKIKYALKDMGVNVLFDSPTNQQFPIFKDEVLQKLSEKYSFCYWCRVDDTHSAVRICTSWATKEDSVDALLEDIRKLV